MNVLVHDDPSFDSIDELDSQGVQHIVVQYIQSAIALRLPRTVDTHNHHGIFLDCVSPQEGRPAGPESPQALRPCRPGMTQTSVLGMHDDATQRWSALLETPQHECWLNNFSMSAGEHESLFELL
jgi:hypothetical protein